MKLTIPLSALLLLLVGCRASPPSMLLDHATVVEGTDISARFEPAIEGLAADQFWIQLAPVGAPDSLKEGRYLLDRGTTVYRLPVDAPGTYEVRLHGASPDHPPSIVARHQVTVYGAEHVIASLDHPGLPAGREIHALSTVD